MAKKVYKRPKDIFGVRIRLGDKVVYPVYKRGVTSLQWLVVSEVPGRGYGFTEGIVGFNQNRSRVVLKRTDRCAVVKRFELED